MEEAFAAAYQSDKPRRLGPEGEIAYRLGFCSAWERLAGPSAETAKCREACAEWEQSTKRPPKGVDLDDPLVVLAHAEWKRLKEFPAPGRSQSP